jgi:hypothetical protein
MVRIALGQWLSQQPHGPTAGAARRRPGGGAEPGGINDPERLSGPGGGARG